MEEKDIEIGKRIAAREILNIIEEISFSKKYAEFRCDKGSRGERDLIISRIKERYGV